MSGIQESGELLVAYELFEQYRLLIREKWAETVKYLPVVPAFLMGF